MVSLKDRVEMRTGRVTHGATLCFPRENGGDLKIEAGDLVVITVVKPK